MVRVAAGVGVSALTARIMDPDEMGAMALLASVAAFGCNVFLAWNHVPLIRFGVDAYNKVGSVRRIWDRRLPLLVVSLIFVLIVSVPPVAQIWARHLDIVYSPIYSIIIFFCAVSMYSTTEMNSYGKIAERFHYIGLTQAVNRCLWCGVLAAIFLTGAGMKAREYLFGMWGLNLLIAIIGFLILNRRHHLFRKPEGEYDVGIGRMIYFGYPVILSMLVSIFYMYGNQWLLNATFSSFEVGQYQVAFGLLLFLTSQTSVITELLLPKIIKTADRSNELVAQMIRGAIPLTNALWSGILIAGAAVTPELYRALYSDRYAPGIPLMIVLLSGGTMSALSACYSPYFMQQGRIYKNAYFHLLGIGQIALVFFLFHKTIGTAAAALGITLSYLIIGFLCASDIQRRAGVIERGQILIALFASAVIVFNLPLLDFIFLRILFAVLALACICLYVKRKNYYASFDEIAGTKLPKTMMQLLRILFGRVRS